MTPAPRGGKERKMRTAEQARQDGLTIDRTCYPWLAYSGPRFEPDYSEKVLTDKEAAADALATDADKAVLAIQDAQNCIWSLLQEGHAQNCIWSLLQEGHANNVADLLRSIDIAQTKLASTLIEYREAAR